MIRSVQIDDAFTITEIYNYYILNTCVTFEKQVIEASEMERRIEESSSKLPWMVYEENGEVFGYAFASEWKSRSAYKHSAEISVYLRHDAGKRGIGTQLYAELIRLLKEMNFHALIGGIALPNEASIALHEKFGFEKVAHFREVGFKFEQWVDVAYWELLLPN